MAAHGVPFTVAGALTGPYAPGIATSDIRVCGLTVTNSTATAAAVVVRDGSSTGNVIVAGPVGAIAGSVPGILDINLCQDRVALNGLYVEIDGGAATGVVWVK